MTGRATVLRAPAALQRVLRVAGAALLIAGALSLPAGADAPIRFQRLGIEQGLSQSTVLCTHQDSRGFVWVGTEDGLNRFDGYRVTTYTHDPADPASLAHDTVWAIAEDRGGDLWLATAGGGVSIWDRATDRFRQLASSARGGPLGSDFVRTLAFDPSGRLWVGTRDAGLDVYDPRSGRATPYRHLPNDPASLGDDRVFAIHFDRAGTAWIGTESGLDRYDAANDRFVHSGPDADALAGVRALAEGPDGALWIGTRRNGLFRLGPEDRELTRFRHDPADRSSLGADHVRAILLDRERRLWIGTAAGLDRLDPGPGSFTHHRNEPTRPSSLSENHVTSLMQDRGGVLWVGTRTAGLHHWNPRTWQFGHHTAGGDEDGLASHNVMSFTEDGSGKLWVGTLDAGVEVLDRTSGNATWHRHIAGDANTPASNRVTALLTDRTGRIWIGTMDAGLDRYDPADGTFTHFRHEAHSPSSLAANGVMSLLEDSAGNLWVGTFGGGLDRFDPGGETFVHHRHDPNDPASLGSDRVTCLVEDGDGLLWVGTDGAGLERFDPLRGTFTHFRNDPQSPSSLGSDTVFSLYLDGDDTLWVGTRGAGLNQLPAARRTSGQPSFVRYTERDGLPNDVVYGILEDGFQRLWLSTNRGLSRFDPAGGGFVNYDASDGLQSDEFNFGAAYRSADGELFFGGVAGFNAFRPETLQPNSVVPQVVLTSFLKFNRPVPGAGPASEIRAVDLGYRDDVVTFEFAALDFASPAGNRYAYMLEGFDTHWIDLGGVHRVTYTDLRAGDYVLRVRAANSDGTWNQDGLSVAVHVAPPPWQTGWAYLGYTLLLAGAIGAVVRVQRKKRARETAYTQRLEREVDERTRELSERNTELAEANHKLLHASVTDSLTGMANRRFLTEYLDKEVELIQRRYTSLAAGALNHESFDLVFMMIDLDQFKTINDTCGHAAGDAVLTQMRGILQQAARASDILIRWGGDEFLVVGRDADPGSVESLAERVRSRVEAHPFELPDGRVMRLTCTVGFACYPFLRSQLDVLSWEQVISIADLGLYVAKRSGRNAWVGLSATRSTPSRGLLQALRHDPEQLVADGLLAVHTSLAADQPLAWGIAEERETSARERVQQTRPRIQETDGDDVARSA